MPSGPPTSPERNWRTNWFGEYAEELQYPQREHLAHDLRGELHDTRVGEDGRTVVKGVR